MGGCGIRSHKFRDGNMLCAECRAKRAASKPALFRHVTPTVAPAPAAAPPTNPAPVTEPRVRKEPEARVERVCARSGCTKLFPSIANRRFCSEECQRADELERRNARYSERNGVESLAAVERRCKHCQEAFTPRYPAENYCVNCKGHVPIASRSKRVRKEMSMENTSNASLTIVCERGLGRMVPFVCGKRWAIAKGLTVKHTYSPHDVTKIKKSACSGCPHGESRFDKSEIVKAAPAARAPAPALPAVVAPSPALNARTMECINCFEVFGFGEEGKIPLRCPTCVDASPAEQNARYERAMDRIEAKNRAPFEAERVAVEPPAPSSAPRCACGNPIVRKPGQVGRLSKQCDECRGKPTLSKRAQAEAALEALLPPRPRAPELDAEEDEGPLPVKRGIV